MNARKHVCEDARVHERYWSIGAVPTGSQDAIDVVSRQEDLLVYVFQTGVPAVQASMTSFPGDLCVVTEGRKFIFFYAKLTQLQ